MGKKKLSVAEILAAARKADGGGAAPKDDDQTPAEEAAQQQEKAAEPAAPEAEKPAPEKPAPEKPKAKPGQRLSVAEMLAAARAEKAGGGPAEKPKPAAAKPVAAKPTAAKAPAENAATAEKKAAPAGPPSTASILEAARAEKKRGPVSKAEAGVAISKPAKAPAPAKAKVKPSAPPMPAKPAYAKPAAGGKGGKKVDEERRGFLAISGLMVGTALGIGFTSMATTFGLWTLGLARFMFPNILTEPPSQFKIGFPADFPPGEVVTKFKAQFGIWVVNGEYNGEREIYALSTVCTHLGCTPNWLEAEQKFKCPCHGSGFYKDGINFEGPAPRPLERYAIALADDGQLAVDKSKKFQQEKGEWESPDSFVIA